MASAIIRPLPQPIRGVMCRAGVAHFYHRTVMSTGGTISSQDAANVSGMSIVKTAATTGRYTLTLGAGVTYKQLLWVEAMIIGPNTAAYGAVTVGLGMILRANDIDGNNNDGTIEVQFIGNNAGWADAEVADNVTLLWQVTIQAGV